MITTSKRLRRALVALIALAATGCGADRAYSEVHLVNGTATYQVTAEGVAASGWFTLLVSFPSDAYDYGDESEVYLHRLQLADEYAYGIDDLRPEIEQVTSNRPQPFVATVGNESSATFNWSTAAAATIPSQLCDGRLVAQVYLSLGDELVDVHLDANGGWYPGSVLLWSPDPCHE